eukprot:14265462-Ditylum_brightwellii.AAC.1
MLKSNIQWTPLATHQYHQIGKKHDSNIKFIVMSSDDPSMNLKRPRGCYMGITDNYIRIIINHGQNDHGLGQWMYCSLSR